VRALAPVDVRGEALSLSVVVLSYNRRPALLETLRRLHESPATRHAEVVVVDNGSADGSAAAVSEAAPWAKLIALDANEAIAGFNLGVETAQGELVLILDDDARPDPEAIARAVELLARRADLGAVTFVPFHPETGRSEWPFAETMIAPRDDWPVMGCCNLVRRRVWRAVGGYEREFFLYRNDVDLALKILATGLGVHCDPAWRCEHDSPAAARKSKRWFRLATRNWAWLARRHNRGWRALSGACVGWAWAHGLAGISPRRHWNALCGAFEGFVRIPPSLPSCVHPDGRAFALLLALRWRGRRR
jgi:GT2 family glycosyltransferase